MTTKLPDRSDPKYWQSERIAKYSPKGAVRGVPPSVTIRRASKVLTAAGVTKIAEVTHLDRIGIPNFMAVRPADLGPGISYYNGKGVTRADAHAGAIMEAIERHAGESCGYDVTFGSFADLIATRRCINPAELSMPFLLQYSKDLQIEWVTGVDLLKNEPALVPLNCVVCPYEPPDDRPTLFRASTNGLASGNSITEALCHAIFEVIERDAYALAVADAELGPAVATLLGNNPKDRRAGYRQVRLDGLPRRAAALVRKIQRAGLKVYLRDFSPYAPIAVLDCAIVEYSGADMAVAYGGLGAHLDASVALLRAITEAAQSRIGMIQGGREDLPHLGQAPRRFDPDAVFGRGELVSFSDIKTTANEFIDDDLREVLARMPDFGLTELIAFDMTHPDVNIPVVRVVAPQSETWTVYHLHTGRGAFGKRASILLSRSMDSAAAFDFAPAAAHL